MKLFKRIFLVLRNKGLLSWMPDKPYLSLYYFVINGRWPNLKNPHLFTEKLQWLKLYDHNPIYSVMADKYLVKNFVSEKIGEKYIIPLIGVWEKTTQIPFDELPNRFVLKTTHDSGGVVVIDKAVGYDREKITEFLQMHLDRDLYRRTREWPYKNIQHRIIAEEYMESNVVFVEGVEKQVLLDYKFYCFNGEPKFLYIGYSNMKNGIKHDLLSFFDLNWERPDFYRSDHKPIPFEVSRPQKMDEMIEVCRKLSKDIPFVRVDLYYVDNNIYFSELTFSPGSGFSEFEPIEWARKIGDWIELPSKK